jgi:hypothetical protein
MNNSLFLNLFDIVQTKNPKHASGFFKIFRLRFIKYLNFKIILNKPKQKTRSMLRVFKIIRVAKKLEFRVPLN